MSQKKRLTSDPDEKSPGNSGKRLTGEDVPGSGAAAEDGRRLTGEGSGGAAAAASSSEPQGATRRERIRYSTLNGGLSAIPAEFDDLEGDWQTIRSRNVFERLYLDYREYRRINTAMLQRNFQLLLDFWTGKVDAMQTGANRIKIVRKYAGVDGSDRTVKNYITLLKKAFQQLSQPNGIHNSYLEIEERRQNMIREKIEPILMVALRDKTLEPQEEGTIKNFCRSQTDLSEDEIDELIEEYLKKTGSKRGEGEGGLIESERLFVHQIKRQVSNNVLSLSAEKELAADMEVYKVTPKRYEELVLIALKAIEGCEREKTLEKDKGRFNDFYYGLLREFGLTTEDKLNEAASKKLFAQDSSETLFFPLSKETREALQLATIQRYKNDLSKEKKIFFDAALKLLDKYDGHVESRKTLMQDASFTLLLPAMREALCNEAMAQITDNQSTGFIEAARDLYRIHHWQLPQKIIEQFVAGPAQFEHCLNLRYDWLDHVTRQTLFQDVAGWAKLEYMQEKLLFQGEVKTALEKHIYGIPVAEQKRIEGATRYHLAPQERRDIVVEMETPNRQNAEKRFNEMVTSALVFDTLIAEVEFDLFKKGKNELLLNAEKNEISFQTKTAQAILNAHRKPFEQVIVALVKKEADDRKIPEHLVKKFNLSYTACISETDIDRFIDLFKPANSVQRKTIKNAFTPAAQAAQLKIIPPGNITHFANTVIRPIMVEKSKNYKLSINRWMDTALQSDLLNLGAAFGLGKGEVEKELTHIRQSYASWTKPRWKEFATYLFGGIALLLLLRLLAFPAGANDWAFVEPLKWEYLDFWGGETYRALVSLELWMPFPDFDFSGGHNRWWALFQIIANAFLLVIYVIWLFIAIVVNLVPIVLFLASNALILLYNLYVIASYAVVNVLMVVGNAIFFLVYCISYIITRGDYILFFSRGLNLLWPWAALAALLGGVFAIWKATSGLRRSYWISRVALTVLAVLVIGTMAYFSLGKVEGAVNELKGSYEYFPEVSQEIAAVEVAKTGTVSAARGAVVRSGPSRSYSRITALPRGTRVNVQSMSNAWYRIKYNQRGRSVDGYIHNSALLVGGSTMEDQVVAEGRKAYAIVSSMQLLVRKGPGIAEPIIASIGKDTRLEIISENDSWMEVKYGEASNPGHGYVYRNHQ